MRNSIWEVPKPLKDITLDDAIRIIDGVDSFTAEGAGKTLNGELSIRKGRYGHYVYYKTAGMSVPKFFNIKSSREVSGLRPRNAYFLDTAHVFRLEWSGVGGV
jgi:hypothetical protein